jgi:AcrR family transcriptional regulator
VNRKEIAAFRFQQSLGSITGLARFAPRVSGMSDRRRKIRSQDVSPPHHDRRVRRAVGRTGGRFSRRAGELAPREAIAGLFAELLKRSLGDREHKGCMLANAALDVAPHDPDFPKIIAGVLVRIEAFFRDCVEAGRADCTITRSFSAESLAHHLLGLLMGVRVLARVRLERALLEDVVSPALALLDRSEGQSECQIVKQ